MERERTTRFVAPMIIIGVVIAVLGSTLMVGAQDAESAQSTCEGLGGAAFGLCTAFCDAMDCAGDSPQATEEACHRVEEKFHQITGSAPPCRASLRFFYTCGDPVCRGYTGSTGVPGCTAEQLAGEPCSEMGTSCDPMDGCNRLLVCTNVDPTTGGCPISRREAKTNIRYLDDRAVLRLHDEVMRIRLATYKYKAAAETGKTHLGFIIDDVAPSPAVHPSGNTVDLYGYTSMAVAALQMQARQIEALKSDLEVLREQMKRREGPTARPDR
jgi:hypothetical protein